jgi:hypothetical protein
MCLFAECACGIAVLDLDMNVLMDCLTCWFPLLHYLCVCPTFGLPESWWFRVLGRREQCETNT